MLSIRLILFLLAATALHAGPYPPPAGEPGSTAIPHDDNRIVGWANEVVEGSYRPGTGVADLWQDANQALGPAGTSTLQVVSLGEGGTITLEFSDLVANGQGADLAVFENGVLDSRNGLGYLELAFVEVSSDGDNFVRFPSSYLDDENIPVMAPASGDATLIDGLASKYKVGFGTPFDLADLRGHPGSEHLDFNAIRYVRLVDIMGNGETVDSDGRPIYDPYSEDSSGEPVEVSSNGFDLDGIAVLNSSRPALEDVTHHAEHTTLTWSLPSSGQWILQQSTDLENWTDREIFIADRNFFTLDVPASTELVFYRLRRP